MPRDSIWQLFSLSSKFYILSIPLPPCSLSIQGGGWMSCLGTEHSASLVLSTLSCRKSLNHPHSLQREAPLPETGVAFVHQDNTDIQKRVCCPGVEFPSAVHDLPSLEFSPGLQQQHEFPILEQALNSLRVLIIRVLFHNNHAAPTQVGGSPPLFCKLWLHFLI